MKQAYGFQLRTSFVVLLLCVVYSFGADGGLTAEKAREIREIEDNLIAPCCWSQPVSQHYSEEAEQIRNG